MHTNLHQINSITFYTVKLSELENGDAEANNEYCPTLSHDNYYMTRQKLDSSAYLEQVTGLFQEKGELSII